MRSRDRPLTLALDGRYVVVLADDVNLLIDAAEQLLAGMAEQVTQGRASAASVTYEQVASLDSFIDSLATAALTLADPPLEIPAPDRTIVRRLLAEIRGYQRGELTPGLQELRNELERR